MQFHRSSPEDRKRKPLPEPLRRSFVESGLWFPDIPGSQNLSNDLPLVSPRNGFEFLHASGEAVGEIEIAELIGGNSVGAVQPSRLGASDAPAIKKVSIQIELENP